MYYCHEDPEESNKVLLEDSLRFRKGVNQAPLRCISTNEVANVLKEVRSGDCSEREGGSRLFKKILHLGYYWPTVGADALSFAHKCQACQLHSNSIHAPVVGLHRLSTPWPFHT